MFISHFANPVFITILLLLLSCFITWQRLFLSGAEHCTCRNNLTVLSVVIFLVGWFVTVFDSWVSRLLLSNGEQPDAADSDVPRLP